MSGSGGGIFSLGPSGSSFESGPGAVEIENRETGFARETMPESVSGSAEFYTSTFKEMGLIDNTEESTEEFSTDYSEIMEASPEDFYESAFTEMGLMDDTEESTEAFSPDNSEIMKDSPEDFYESVLTEMNPVEEIEESSGTDFSEASEDMEPKTDSEVDASVDDITGIDVDQDNMKEGSNLDDNQNPYRIGNELIPNNEYEINGYKYQTDDAGRIISAEGTLHMKDREGRLPIKDKIEDIGKGDELPGDDRGHLIGDQFDGSNGLENMIPQDADVNQKDYKNFENELAQEVKYGKEVWVKVEPVYEEGSYRPTMLVVTYSVDGETNVRIFPNSKEE